MEFEEVLKLRRSIREFESKEVSENIISKMLALANLSPSAGNLQARRVLVIRDKETKKNLSCAAFDQDFLASASVIFVICAVPEESAQKYGDRGKHLYALQDATIFASYLQLAATSFGLASCWVGAFDEESVVQHLRIPNKFRPIALIPVGYTAVHPSPKPRKELKEIITTL